jgi:hypothetical protein
MTGRYRSQEPWRCAGQTRKPPARQSFAQVHRQRVRNLHRFAERLDARFAKGRAEVDKLAQPILAKAFRGELVSTEAELARREGQSAETAEELLQRIRAKQQNAAGRRHAVPRGKKWEPAHA